jgi:hypothetical protein
VAIDPLDRKGTTEDIAPMHTSLSVEPKPAEPDPPYWSSMVVTFLPLLIIGALFIWLIRRYNTQVQKAQLYMQRMEQKTDRMIEVLEAIRDQSAKRP